MSELTQAELKEFKVDKTGWGEGPWQTEPDREQWTHAGYACLILRHPHGGYLCGYVGVDRAHPAYGKHPLREDVDATAHQDLNYGSACEGLICHVPEPGMPDDVWWLGFDCGHAFDVAPGLEARERARGWPPILTPLMPVYRTFPYVKRETEKLADQLRALAPDRRIIQASVLHTRDQDFDRSDFPFHVAKRASAPLNEFDPEVESAVAGTE
jgi:hypothetical protein